MHLSMQGRTAMPQTYLQQGHFLSWAGFEAVCQDFHITNAPISSAVGPDSRHPPLLANYDHAHVRGTSLNHQLPSKAKPGAFSSKTIRQPDPSARVFSGETPSRGLLSGVQVCIAFVSACTHRSLVASFPNDGKSDGVVSGENGSRRRMSRGSLATEKERMSCAEEDAAYWRVSRFFKYAQPTSKRWLKSELVARDFAVFRVVCQETRQRLFVEMP